MQNTSLVPGLIVVACGEPARIVRWMANARVEVQILDSREKTVVEVEDLKFLPVETKHNDFALKSEIGEIIGTDDVSLKELKEAEEIHLIMTRYLASEVSISEALEILGLKKTRFYRLLEKYDASVGFEALLGLKRGRKAGHKQLSREVEDIITAAVEKIYKGPGTNCVKVFDEVLMQCSKLKIKPPSRSLIFRRMKSLNEKTLHRRKFGAESAEQRYGAKPGKKKLTRPMELVQMDHTRVDCMLCDKEFRVALSRPWVTFIIDVYSRVILGYYIAYHGPSTLSVACAVTHAVLPKNKYLQSLGCVSVQHPFFGVPEILHMDNAKEFRSPKLERACLLHGITASWRPKYAKHYGGHVERLIGTMMTSHVHLLPGTTMSNTKEKEKYPSEKLATMTIGEFTRWFAGQVGIYNYTKHRELKCSPAEAWAKAYNEGGPNGPKVSVIADPSKFRMDFMPEDYRDIHPGGIRFKGVNYWSPELKLHIGSKKAPVKYDPFSMGTIWVKLAGEYIEARQSDVTADDFSYEQHLISVAAGRLKAGAAMPENVIAMREENESVVNESKQKTKEAKKIRRAREAVEAYAAHTVNQLHDCAPPADKKPKAPDIDFSAAPTIYNTEEY